MHDPGNSSVALRVDIRGIPEWMDCRQYDADAKSERHERSRNLDSLGPLHVAQSVPEADLRCGQCERYLQPC